MRLGFASRLVAIILIVVTFQIMGIELLIFIVGHATVKDIPTMLLYPIPLASLLVFIYILIAFLFCSPIFRLFGKSKPGQEPGKDLIIQAQNRAMNLSWFLTGLSFPAYMAGGAGGTWIVAVQLGWPESLWIYGLMGGIIAGFHTAPMVIYAANWVMEPVLEGTGSLLPDRDRVRSGGIGMPLRWKFVIIINALVVATAGYLLIISYTQTDYLINNMERIEELLPAEAAGSLIDTVDSSSDPGIRSSRYFRARAGFLKAFYISLMIGGTALSFFLSLIAARETTRPIRTLQEAAERVMRGHYDEPVRLVSNDEFVELGSAINQMMETIIGNMRDMESIVKNLRDGIRKMDETAGIILTVSTEQASGATEQATTVAETSTIAEEIVATARQISQLAKAVDEAADHALSACHEGDRKLDEAESGYKDIEEQAETLGQSMRQIETRSQETYKIVEWIQDISEQTELLAMNASLEAAGAGEEGRRFSVVAEETRRLALRASEAAREIKGLVESIQEATVDSAILASDGRKKVAKGGEAIRAVVDSIKNISSLAASTSSSAREISTSTDQQTHASEQLATSITEVQNVAKAVEQGAKEIESAVSGLTELSDALRRTVDQSDGAEQDKRSGDTL